MTPELIERFSRGECATLAKELVSISGLSLYACVDERNRPNFHAFVAKEGLALDIKGTRRITEICREYRVRNYVRVDDDAFANWKHFNESETQTERTSLAKEAARALWLEHSSKFLS